MKTKFVQMSCFLFMFYIFWYREAYDYSSVMLYGSTILVAFSTLLYMNRRPLSRFGISNGIKISYGFGLYSLITGIVVAKNTSILLSSLVTYFSFLFVCTCIFIVCKGENSIEWLRKQFIVLAVFCALFTIFNGYDYYNGIIVQTMGQNNNPNALGVFMVFGLFMILYSNKTSNIKMITQLGVCLLFLYVIIITGSKKSLFSAAIFLLFWMFSFVKFLKKSVTPRQRYIWYCILGALVAFGVWFFINKFASTVSFARLQGLFTSHSTISRKDMYDEAWELFKKNPIFGVGYNQYSVVSIWKQYAHSTYAEVLADSGIVGTIIYFIPIIQSIIVILKRLFHKVFNYKSNLIFALACVEIFLGTVNIFMYNFAHMMIWCLLYTLLDKKHMINVE